MRQERSRRSKPLLQEIARIEQEMARLQAAQAECDVFLSQESSYLPENKEKLQQTLAESAQIKVKLGKYEENWLLQQEKLEAAEAALAAEFAGHGGSK